MCAEFPSNGTRKTIADDCDFGNELATCAKDGDTVSEPVDTLWVPLSRVYYRTKLSGPCPQWLGLWYEGSILFRGASLWVWADDTYTFDESGDNLPTVAQYTWNYEQTPLAFSFCPAGGGDTVVHWAWESLGYIGDATFSAWRSNWGVTMDKSKFSPPVAFKPILAHLPSADKFGLHAASEFTLWSGFLNSWLSSAELVCENKTFSLGAPNQYTPGSPNLVARIPTEQPNLLWPYAPHLTDIVYTNVPYDNIGWLYYVPFSDNLFTSIARHASTCSFMSHAYHLLTFCLQRA